MVGGVGSAAVMDLCHARPGDLDREQ